MRLGIKANKIIYDKRYEISSVPRNIILGLEPWLIYINSFTIFLFLFDLMEIVKVAFYGPFLFNA